MTKKKGKNYRMKRKVNQVEFAEDCSLSKNTVCLIEREKENVTIDTVRLLAARMGITVSELFNHSSVTYCIVPGTVDVEGITHKTYGIGALKNGILVKCIHDISTDFTQVKSLVLMCNECGLSIVHLNDVVEDFLV